MIASHNVLRMSALKHSKQCFTVSCISLPEFCFIVLSYSDIGRSEEDKSGTEKVAGTEADKKDGTGSGQTAEDGFSGTISGGDRKHGDVLGNINLKLGIDCSGEAGFVGTLAGIVEGVLSNIL